MIRWAGALDNKQTHIFPIVSNKRNYHRYSFLPKFIQHDNIKRKIHSFFYKNTLYKNIEAENGPKIKNNLRTGWPQND